MQVFLHTDCLLFECHLINSNLVHLLTADILSFGSLIRCYSSAVNAMFVACIFSIFNFIPLDIKKMMRVI